MITKKDKLHEASSHTLGEACSALLMKKSMLQQKLEHRGSFSFPFTIGSVNDDRALVGLDAGINAISYTTYEHLGLGVPNLCGYRLILAYKSVRYPKGVTENVLVKVNDLDFAVHFVVLDMDEDIDFPIFLGSPFPRNSRALIDIDKRKLVFRSSGNELVLKFPLLLITSSKVLDIVCVD